MMSSPSIPVSYTHLDVYKRQGQTAPKGRTMGHAGAIVGGAEDTAQAKMAIMRENGIHVVDSPAEIGSTVAKVLG